MAALSEKRTRKFHKIKPEIRVIGIDDSPHSLRVKSQVPIVGVIFRGGLWIDGVISAKVTVDGFDSTEAISNMITKSVHYKQLRVIMLNGVTFAGFNIVDINQLNILTRLPVIAVTRKKPDMAAITAAVQNLSKPEERLKAILSAGEIESVKNRTGVKLVYIQTAGILKDDAQRIMEITSTRSNIPEPLRVAHIVASGISLCRT